MTKKDIETAIVEILTQRKVKNQTSLAKLLREKGIHADQSTISRQLGKLGIEKKNGAYKLAENNPGTEIQITASPPNLIVIRTPRGFAQAAAIEVDKQPIEGLISTLAGVEDTVLCIIKGPKYLKSINLKLEQILNSK